MTPKAWLNKQVASGRLEMNWNASTGWLDYMPRDGYKLFYRGEELEMVSFSPKKELVLDTGRISVAKTAKAFEVRQ